MLTLRDIPSHLAHQLQDAAKDGFLLRQRTWKNAQPGFPTQEEVYRVAFQDGIRATLKVLPIGEMEETTPSQPQPPHLFSASPKLPSLCTHCGQTCDYAVHLQQDKDFTGAEN